MGVKTVVLAGTQYPNCVRGTANDAMSYDYETVVCTDACSAKTPEVAAANVFDMKNMGIKCISLDEVEKSTSKFKQAGNMRKLYISALLAMSSLSLFAQKSTWADNIRISGFAIAQYQWTNPKDNEANTFNLRMARLALDGKVAGDFYWKTQLQITGNTSTLASSPRVVDLFIEWQNTRLSM